MKDPDGHMSPALERELREVTRRRERKRADELSARLSATLHHSPLGIYLFNAISLYFIYANQRIQRKLGYDMQELRQMAPFDVDLKYSEQQFAALINPLRTRVREQIVFNTFYKRKENSIYPVEVRMHPSQCEGSSPLFTAFVQDTSEGKQAEEVISREKQHVELALQTVGIAYYRRRDHD